MEPWTSWWNRPGRFPLRRVAAAPKVGDQAVPPPLAHAVPLRRRVGEQRLHVAAVRHHLQHLHVLLRRRLVSHRLAVHHLPPHVRAPGPARPLAPGRQGHQGGRPRRLGPQLHRRLGENR